MIARDRRQTDPWRLDAKPADPDHDILSLARDGDPGAALRLLLMRHGRSVYGYCCNALRDATLADDVHQQVFIEAYRHLPDLANRSTVRSWLFAIAHSRVLDAMRVRRRAHARIPDDPVAQLVETPDPRPAPDDSIHDMQVQQALVASLESLSEDARTTIVLRFEQGFTFKEIAAMCGENVSTVHARVTRALLVLRETIRCQLRYDEVQGARDSTRSAAASVPSRRV
jgi:RNA polymerase sigma-70 factor, ECF subfamily